MTIEYLPMGVKCNLSCTYCYQEPMRKAGNLSSPLNFVRAKEIIKKAGADFVFFGGEPLLTPIEHLEEMWKYGFERFGKNGIQTNGSLITSAHIDLFHKYRVNVGVSLDGSGACNRVRCDDLVTESIIENIKSTKEAGVDISLITTIHRANATRMLDLLNFFDDMESIGIKWINLHNLEVDSCTTRNELMLTDEENFSAFKSIYEFSAESRIKFNPFEDIRNLLTRQNFAVSCIWTGCDPLSTPAVHGINAEGSLVNCGRTNKTGIDYLKSKDWNQERYVALASTEQEHGGCKGCRYLFACKGQCPGTAIDGDWRNRTRDCVFWYKLIEHIENDLITKGLETLDIDQCNKAFTASIYQQNQGHGDVPHGDSHGDHTDSGGHWDRPRKRIRPDQLGLQSGRGTVGTNI